MAKNATLFRVILVQLQFYTVGINSFAGQAEDALHRLARTGASFEITLPRITIDTHGQAIQRWERVTAEVAVIEPENGEQSVGGTVRFKGHAGVAVRGSGSTVFPKHSYRLELVGVQGRDKKVSLLGMPEESDWILLASYNDKTLIRDPLAYELWRALGYYAPRWRYGIVRQDNTLDRPHPGQLAAISSPRLRPQPQEREKSLPPSAGTNVMADYAGVYVLVEKIKRGRID